MQPLRGFPLRAGFTCFVTDCRLSFVFLVLPLIPPRFPLVSLPSGKRGKQSGSKPQPCFPLRGEWRVAPREVKLKSCLISRLPLGEKLSTKLTDEGRSPFLIEIFHRKFSIKGQLHFLYKNFSNEGEVPSPKSRSVNAPPCFPLFCFFSWGRKARKNLR